MGITEKNQKEGPALPSTVVLSWTNDRREIPVYPRLLPRNAPELTEAQLRKAVTSTGQWWGHQELFQGLGHGQLCSPPHPWQPPASTLYHPCPSSRMAKLTPWLRLWGITAAGISIGPRNHCSWAQSSSWPSPWRHSRDFYPGCDHWLSQTSQRALNY